MRSMFHRAPVRIVAVLALAAPALAVAACGRSGDDSSGGGSASHARGVTDTSIKIGGTFPFTGPLAVYGTLSKGFGAYLAAVNVKGGVNGRKLEYTTLDDAYDPSRVVSNVRKLVQQDGSFMVVDFGAGPLSARSFAETTKTPQYILGGLAYDAKYPMTRSWWPEIPWEGAVDGQFIAKNVPDPKVATIAVNNEVAPALVAGVKAGLGAKKSAFVDDVRYEATQVDLSSQVNKLRSKGVNALVCLVTGSTEVQLLKYIHQIGWHPKVFLYSGTVSRKSIFEPAGLESAKDVYSAMWLKDPSDPHWAKDAQLDAYRSDIAKYGKGADAADIVTANGYAAAQAVVKALGTMDDPTQEGFIKALDAFPSTPLPLLQPGIALKPGPDAHLVSQYQVVQFDGDGYKAVGSPVQVPGS